MPAMMDIVRAAAVYCLAMVATILAWRLTPLGASGVLGILVLSSVLVAWPVGRMTRRGGPSPMLRAAAAIVAGTVVGTLVFVAFVAAAVPAGDWFVPLVLMAQFIVCLPLAVASAVAGARLPPMRGPTSRP